MPVPPNFQEEVKRACLASQCGDLRLLAFEAQSFEWRLEGLRLIGEAQFSLKAYPGARATYEALRKDVPDDLDANLKLGTIYQKLATDNPQEIDIDLLARSDQAIERTLSVARTSPQRAGRSTPFWVVTLKRFGSGTGGRRSWRKENERLSSHPT